ncbi:MAG: LuxR C-terminal-related transcriptional regulator [Paracoccus sp. (in: a-proteobacteria)]|uniref:LuxR C-terminal-related transcriptional regulator n=1 Tax=Paracoccus sp. TaxID=267 RepID=UPI0039194CE0
MSRMMITTKLVVPNTPQPLMARPHLRLLDAHGAPRTLVLVEAPAGYGKTTLLAEWAHNLPLPAARIAWLTADPGDNREDRFMTYLTASLDRAGIGGIEDDPQDPEDSPVGPASTRVGSAVPPLDRKLSGLINRLSRCPDPVFVFIDNACLLDDPGLQRTLLNLLIYSPPNLHMVLAMRRPCTLPLAGLRARGQLAVVPQAALRLTLAETRALILAAPDAGLTDDRIGWLHQRCEGWPAGIVLARQALTDPGLPTGFADRMAGAEGAIAEFLSQEVLARLPDDLLAVLRVAALPKRISVPLVVALTDQPKAAGLLEQACAVNIFLTPAEGVPGWFCFHAQLRDLLRRQLAGLQGDALKGLHLRAAHWLHAAGHVVDAIPHALAAGQPRLAADMIEDCCMTVIASRSIADVRGWLSALPDAVVEDRPRLMLARVWIAFHTSRPMTGFATLRRARHLIATRRATGAIPEDEATLLQAEIGVLYVGILSAAEHSRMAIVLGRRVLAQLPPRAYFLLGTLTNTLSFCHCSVGDLVLARQMALQALEHHGTAGSAFGLAYAQLNLGLADKSAGALDQASLHFARARSIAQDAEGQGAYSDAMVALFEAELHYERGDLARAEQLVAQIGPVIRECGLIVHAMTASLLAARLAAARGQAEQALRLLEDAERGGLATRYRRLFAMSLHERIKILIDRGEVTLPRLILDARGLPEPDLHPMRPQSVASELEQMALARVLIAEARPQVAYRLLERQSAAIRRDGRMRRLIQLRALASVAAFAANDAISTLAAVAEAVGLAAQTGAVRSLADEGAAFGQVLRFGLTRIPAWQPPQSPARVLVDRLLDQLAPPARAASQAPALSGDPAFSPREREVARLLLCGASNKEIGATLSLAPDTVKWHLKNIFGKLSVPNRTQAALRLQQIGETGPGLH